MKEPLNNDYQPLIIAMDGRYQTVDNILNLLVDYKLQVIYRYVEIDYIEADLKNGSFPNLSETLSIDVCKMGGWITITTQSDGIQYAETYSAQRIIQA